VVIVNGLTHRAKITGRWTAVMVVLLASVVVAVAIAMIIVLTLLRAAAVMIVALISIRMHQWGRAKNQHTQAGYQTFRHFHQFILTAHTAKRASERSPEALGLAD
jgi:hypothetical protein